MVGSSRQRDPDLVRFYASLEIPYGSDPEQVKAAWKRLMTLYHPDRYQNEPDKLATAQELCQGLTRARQEIEKAWREGRIR